MEARHDDGRVPVLRREARGLRFPCRVEVRVVLQQVRVPQELPQRVRRLLDDRRVGNHVDDSPLPVLPRVPEGERRRRERLAAARRHGQRNEPRPLFGGPLARRADLGTDAIHLRCGGAPLLRVKFREERRGEVVKRGISRQARRRAPLTPFRRTSPSRRG